MTHGKLEQNVLSREAVFGKYIQEVGESMCCLSNQQFAEFETAIPVRREQEEPRARGRDLTLVLRMSSLS